MLPLESRKPASEGRCEHLAVDKPAVFNMPLLRSTMDVWGSTGVSTEAAGPLKRVGLAPPQAGGVFVNEITFSVIT